MIKASLKEKKIKFQYQLVVFYIGKKRYRPTLKVIK